jgi:uncharacterized membrane protein
MKRSRSHQPEVELWKTVHHWLSSCGIKLSPSYCKDEITTHPDYPSLLSVADFLQSGGLNYTALQADPSCIEEFEYPLLAHFKEPGNEYLHTVNSQTDWRSDKIATGNWSGVVVFLEKNEQWKNKENNIYMRNDRRKKAVLALLTIAGVGIFLYSLFQIHHFSANAMGAFSLAGLIISILTLQTELGFQSNIVKQVCNSFSEKGCEKVVKSQISFGMPGVTPADAAVLYFLSQFLVYLLSIQFPELREGLFLLTYPTLLIAIWSLYTQAVKIKQWCALCLGIVSVLIIQSGIGIASGPFLLKGAEAAAYFLVIYLILGLLYLPIKSVVKTNSAYKVKLTELKKWKLDGDLFLSLWKDEQEIDHKIWSNDLIIGQPSSPLLITVACNLYCKPCSLSHEKLDSLLRRFEGMIKVQFRFLCSVKNEPDKGTIALRAILGRSRKLPDGDVHNMLADWFKYMDYDRWMNHWGHIEHSVCEEQLESHSRWMEQNRILYTPTFFLNGRKFPGRYSLDDFEDLIPQLADAFEK